MSDLSPQKENGVGARLRRALAPPPAGETAGLPQWRERMFFFTMGPGLVLGLVAYFIGLPMLISRGNYLVMTLDSAMLAMAITIFVLRWLSLVVRLMVLLLMVYLIGLAILLTFGPMSSGAFWLFLLPILAALYLGRSATVALGWPLTWPPCWPSPGSSPMAKCHGPKAWP